MKKLLIVLLGLMLAGNALAIDVAGVNIPSEVEVAGEKLQLNGAGVRKKFVFVKVYVGSLYTAEKASTTAEVIKLPGSKLIRMDFLYKKVEKKKIVDAFAEGFENNAPQLVATPPARTFFGFFKNDFVAGDQVDLVLGANGAVSAAHNGQKLGTIESKELADGILLIYLGDQPADADMKEGMLGKG
jgi:hypothetical protein